MHKIKLPYKVFVFKSVFALVEKLRDTNAKAKSY